ncbi:NADP-dependent oxidoreductase domain-containing protein, partial [Ephemerocybe angulata]
MPQLFAPLPPPASKLGYYRKLSTLAGVQLSPIALGGGNIGDKWHEYGMGSMTKESSFKLLNGYFDLGGNFIDTANDYQDGSSEEFIGEWAEGRDIRDQLFIATKYTSHVHHHNPKFAQQILFSGNSAKSMHLSVESSLKRLRTTYLDLLYIHWWDFTTSIQEIMHALHALVLARKVLYLGISDAPAWVVSQANEYAKCNALTPFCVYQGKWGILDRSFERDIIPMARSQGMALAPWGVLGGGRIRTDEEEERRRKTGENGRTIFNPEWERTPAEKAVCNALEKVAKEIGAKHINSVAIAYVMHKTQFVFPIIGGRSVEHLLTNIEALEITLTNEQISFIESSIPFDLGFPHNIIGDGEGNKLFNSSSGYIDYWPRAQPIKPSKK